MKYYSLEQCKKVGERFRLIRKELGVSAEQVAEQVGITVWCYRLIEEGIEEKLEVELAEKIAMKLGILKTKILPESPKPSGLALFDAANYKSIEPVIKVINKAMSKTKKKRNKSASKDKMLPEGQKIMARRKELGLSRKKLEKLAALPENSLPPIELRGECLWPERVAQINKVLDEYIDEKDLRKDIVKAMVKTVDEIEKQATESFYKASKEAKAQSDLKEVTLIAHAMMAGILMRDCGLTKDKALEVAKVMTELFVFMDQLVGSSNAKT